LAWHHMNVVCSSEAWNGWIVSTISFQHFYFWLVMATSLLLEIERL